MPCRRVLLFFVSASSGQNSTSEQKLSSMVLFDGYLCTASEACAAFFFFFLSIISKLALVCIPPTISFGESRRVSARNLNQRLKKKNKTHESLSHLIKKKKNNQCFGAHL